MYLWRGFFLSLRQNIGVLKKDNNIMIRQKSVLRFVLFILLLSLGMKSITAQTPYRQYANDGVELNFFVIENVDFRACLLYNLTLDDRFVLIPEDENGILSLSSNDDLSREDFFDTFEDFYPATIEARNHGLGNNVEITSRSTSLLVHNDGYYTP